MKRLILLATMVAVLASCEKHEIRNEVLTPIDFTSNVGKQTKAIVDNTTYSTTQPFGVYAYGHQNSTITTVMNNVEISQVDRASGQNTVKKWAATGNTKYYWPNDPTTTINFYAYSPAHNTSNASTGLKEHQVLNGTISHSETIGLSLTNYVHSNMYVDFMEATPVTGATFSDPDGAASGSNLTNGEVPLTFNHRMTQVIFNITKAEDYPNVTFTIEEITLKNIHNCGNYKGQNTAWEQTSVINTSNKGVYTIFPADSDNGAVFAEGRATVQGDNTLEAPITLNSSTTSMQTTGVTMIPQTIAKATSTEVAGTDSYKNETVGQMFMIKYKVQGTGVAEETVTKHVPFRKTDAAVINWGVNKKITYNVSIGLNEIRFDPKVDPWENENSSVITIN